MESDVASLKLSWAWLILLCMVPPAAAEVADKMSSQPSLYVSGALVGAILLVLVRWSKWANVVALPVALFSIIGAYDTLSDQAVMQAISAEQGPWYTWALWASAALIVAGVVIGNVWRWRARHIASRSHAEV